ncbi:MAG: histidine kinase [Desulfobacteraceae bacterium]|nr:histidine kinase [Desulfobacteraceae bacterium]MBC2758082.1 histidine kinase [Desulfobacteraceae bacterium]
MKRTQTTKGGETASFAGAGIPESNGDGTKNYFRRLKKRLLVSMSIAFLVPLMILSVYFHVQFNMTLKKSSKLQLISLAESLTNTIDLFLQERVVNIFNLFHGSAFNLNPTQQQMNAFLQNLIETSSAFIDVGFLDKTGSQIGYAGPFPYLQGQNYSKELWFMTLMNQAENYYVSDIYMGFRNKPHFTIAVKQRVDNEIYVMRATLDPDKFYLFLRSIGRGKEVNAALTNEKGEYQVVDPGQGTPLEPSHFIPPVLTGSGVTEISKSGRTELVACTWLREVPWVLSITQPLNIAYADMYKARRIIIFATILVIIMILSVILFSTSRLLNRAEANEEARKELKSQLFHAAKLVSVGELAAGIAHEINNPLAIISSQCGVIRDMFDPEVGGDAHMKPETPDNIVRELGIVDEAVSRAKDITQKLLKSARKSKPKLEKCNVNQILDDVVDGLMEKEFQVENIELVKEYDSHLPEIFLDSDQIYQVFQNLVNNAGDAIEGPGKVTLTTRVKDEKVQVVVSDTGKGMTHEQMGKIFLPFFTTKEVGKGTGLGLGISLSIVEAMGGTIDVQSMPDAGSSFIVSLPINYKEV